MKGGLGWFSKNFSWPEYQFHSRRWGSSHKKDPPPGPPSTWAEICRPMCLQSHLQLLRSFVNTPLWRPNIVYWGLFRVGNPHILLHVKFRNPRTTFEITPLCPPKYNGEWGRGGTQIFYWNPNIFWVRSLCKVSEPYNNPLWDFSNGGKKKKVPKIIVSLEEYIPLLTLCLAQLYCCTVVL